MYEEYKRDHLARITDEEVLETIAENKEKAQVKHSKSGIIVKVFTMWQFIFPNAAVRYRAMRSLVLLPEEEAFPFIVPTVST